MMVRDFFVCIAVDGRESEVTGGTGGTILISHLAMAFLVCKEWRDRGGKGVGGLLSIASSLGWRMRQHVG